MLIKSYTFIKTNNKSLEFFKDISEFCTFRLYEAKFVQDETVPDGTVLSPSTTFMKSWRVLNSGKRVWTHSTKVSFRT